MIRKKQTSDQASGKIKKPVERTDSTLKTKIGQLETMLRTADGATVAQLSKALDWQAHSVRGAISGTLKRRGLAVTSEVREGERVYRIVA